MRVKEPDPTLQRIERSAWGVCLALALVATVVPHGSGELALAVLGGGALAGVSYRGIRRGVERLASLGTTSVESATNATLHRSHARGVARAILGVLVRYALLALIAYVMISRLRLHPVGLVLGVSCVVAAVGIEAVRSLLRS